MSGLHESWRKIAAERYSWSESDLRPLGFNVEGLRATVVSLSEDYATLVDSAGKRHVWRRARGFVAAQDAAAATRAAGAPEPAAWLVEHRKRQQQKGRGR